ncbi:hypothetical protein CONPUDRAFT_163838 [Coniophora puteana RWD-64-598 SS2]|uniref:BTB domain-containing protein n=1 Tax=Coniophora puteana (strain RWD-64-598) TaxID=741705 RepID=A0A5M3MUB2_CONPW|nr:uncharacterized protein CONPUDRAFT_163838 [Coniophora puteana RWD-64-598 SS2]EIW82758.1 hypothetical protein CONPUDRAFT_163838 [Coniophora puteana RWD-64-598 SS2]
MSEGQLGLTHQIGGSLSCAHNECYILVKVRIEGDLTSAGPMLASALRQFAVFPGVEPVTKQALAKSLSDGTFIDTKFNAFTRRRQLGSQQRLYSTLPLYAASSTFKSMDDNGPGDFSDIVGTNWANLLSAVDCGRLFVDVDDEYEEDSDFDPEEEHIIEEVVGEDGRGSVSGTSDAISVSSSGLSNITPSEVPSMIPPSVSKTILVTGAAYKTWKAFLFYAYTGQTSFTPLTSIANIEELRTSSTMGKGDVHSDCPPCSPKSMYRLAHKLQLESLKQIAFKDIERKLNKTNILHEVLSKFTSKYPEIQEMEIRLLLARRHEQGVMDTLPNKMEQIMRGEMPHCKEVLTAIMLAGIKRD